MSFQNKWSFIDTMEILIVVCAKGMNRAQLRMSNLKMYKTFGGQWVKQGALLGSG